MWAKPPATIHTPFTGRGTFLFKVSLKNNLLTFRTENEKDSLKTLQYLYQNLCGAVTLLPKGRRRWSKRPGALRMYRSSILLMLHHGDGKEPERTVWINDCRTSATSYFRTQSLKATWWGWLGVVRVRSLQTYPILTEKNKLKVKNEKHVHSHISISSF